MIIRQKLWIFYNDHIFGLGQIFRGSLYSISSIGYRSVFVSKDKKLSSSALSKNDFWFFSGLITYNTLKMSVCFDPFVYFGKATNTKIPFTLILS